MTLPFAFLRNAAPVAAQRPWPRFAVDAATWREAVEALAAGTCDLLGLWAEPGVVHLALSAPAAGPFAVLSLACPEGRFPSVGSRHAPAIRLERAIHDLQGLVPEGAADTRPWLDHGRWGLTAPLGDRTPAGEPQPYRFLAAEGPGLHQIPVGPVHAGIIEPGHFRFHVSGETVVRLEARLGYVHKGVEGLLAGASLEQAARLAGRVCGDSTVAYALGFALAAEAALGLVAPPRAQALRGVMAELERLANHLGDIGAICNDASFALMLAHCGVLREQVLRAADAAFGHRLMRDTVVPGGVAADLAPAGAEAIAALVRLVRRRFPGLVTLYDTTSTLQDRTVGTGILQPALARRFAVGGYVGRASGRAFDARRTPGYAPYERLQFEVPELAEGDVNARVWIRIREVQQSLALLEQLLAALPDGPVRHALPAAGEGAAGGGEAGSGQGAEGVALVEAFRGDLLVWLRLDAAGRVARCHLRDASWFQWPVLEAAIEGNIVADFPLCNKSFNCCYSGHDL